MIQELLNYQVADKRLFDLEKKYASDETVNKYHVAVKTVKAWDEFQQKVDAKALELVQTYEKFAKDKQSLVDDYNSTEDMLETVVDEKQAQYLIKKIDELIGKIKALGDKAKTVKNEIQHLLKDYMAKREKVVAQKKVYDEIKPEYQKIKEETQKQKAEIEAELEKLKKKVSPELMSRYQKKRETNVKFPILVPVNGENCGGCGMDIASAAKSKVKSGEIIDCESCGRLLYQM